MESRLYTLEENTIPVPITKPVTEILKSVISAVGRKTVSRRLNVNGLLALFGMAGPLVLLVADIVAIQSASSIEHHYILTRDAISLLALMPMGWVQTIGFLAVGLFIELFTAGLFLSIRRSRGFGPGLTCLGLFGFGLLLIGAFHTDIPGQPPTTDGSIHNAAAAVTFWLLPTAALFLVPSLKNDPKWRPIFPFTIGIAVFALAWMLMFKLFLPDDLSWFGMYERILVAAEVLWVETMAMWGWGLGIGGWGRSGVGAGFNGSDG